MALASDTVIKPEPHFCSVESIAQGEQLTGSAPRADAWFLLEYPGRWGNKALKESTIPEGVKGHLNTQLDAVPESRLLLIKQSKTEHMSIAFFAALPTADPPALYRFQLKDYSELLTFDLAAIAAQDARYDSARTIEPVFVTCTNGLRDRCCALHGVASYWTLAEQYPGLIWESTHHGGHRFAANFLHLPFGNSYGRLRPESAPAVMQAGLDGLIALDHFRGRTIYTEHVQAAEAMLRKATGHLGVNDLVFLGSGDLGPDQWTVRFSDGVKTHEVLVRREETGAQVHVSCGDETMGPVSSYVLEEHKIS